MRTETHGGQTGIVIAQDAITGALVHWTRGFPDILARGAVETPRGAVEGASIMDPAAVGQAIRDLRRQMGVRSRVVSIAIHSPGYQMRTLRLPDVPVAERRLLVRNELESMSALPVGSGGLDFLWTAAPLVEGRHQADASVYYADDSEVEAVRSALRPVGLLLDVLEPASIAIMRGWLAGNLRGDPVALLCPSRKHSDLLIHDGQRVRLVRRIPSGWDDLTRPDEAQTPAAAGQPFIPAGVPVPTLSGIPGMPETAAEGMAGLQRSTGASFLAAEVNRSLAFFAREYENAPQPARLVVLTPEAYLEATRNVLEQSLAIPIVGEDPLAGANLPPPVGSAGTRVPSLAYLAAVGVALGEVEGTIPVVDISHQEDSAAVRRRAPSILMAGMAGSTIWMLAALGAALALNVMQSNLQNEISGITTETSRLREERAPLLRAAEIEAAARAAAEKTRAPASSILGRIAGASLPGVSLTRIAAAADGKVTIEGKAADEESIRRFADGLNQGVSMKGPRFEDLQIDKEGLGFTLSARYRAAEGEGG